MMRIPPQIYPPQGGEAELAVPVPVQTPYQNVAALLAYYLGIFSIVPLVGSPLGIAAVLLGICGLRGAQRHPEASGKFQAWVGIIVGGLCGLLYTVLLAITISAARRGH
jgi:hypothetical protein